MTTRYCFVRDDDGHNYLINARDKQRFYDLCYGDNGDDGYALFNEEFAHCCIDAMTNWTFTDPKENA